MIRGAAGGSQFTETWGEKRFDAAEDLKRASFFLFISCEVSCLFACHRLPQTSSACQFTPPLHCDVFMSYSPSPYLPPPLLFSLPSCLPLHAKETLRIRAPSSLSKHPRVISISLRSANWSSRHALAANFFFFFFSFFLCAVRRPSFSGCILAV